jgi:hypothetical protein
MSTPFPAGFVSVGRDQEFCFKYVMISFRSFSFFKPAKAILVPLMYSWGLVR